jgi:hypothetical protein
MNTLQSTYIAASPILVLSSSAWAHGGREGATLHHYLTSPDHVAALGLTAVAALFCCARLARRIAVVARRNKRPPC